ncbi:unnamed protein product [Phytomonas sp. EM1]|nr:unnamed protein product [Phytomonas sp. EM1]|eukprot:CCW62848.1 unnamed protein product [Phytomonas sp. isolate EM1]
MHPLQVYLLLVCVAFLCVLPQIGQSMETQHGEKWKHLDCSACLVVARVLETRMNSSLEFGPTTYLVASRMEEGSKSNNRRLDFRTSEARAIEVLEYFCDAGFYHDYPLRLNSKTKVRGYHLRTHGDMRNANYTELNEDHFFPPDLDRAELDKMHSEGKLPLARLYTAGEIRELSVLTTSAPEQFCVRLMAEHEELLEEIIKYANSLSELEAHLCGFRWQEMADSAAESSSSDSKDLFKVLGRPLTRVCEDAAALQASATLDQQRWEAWENRSQGRDSMAKVAKEVELNRAPRHAMPNNSHNVHSEKSNNNNSVKVSKAENEISDVNSDTKDL